MALTVDEEKRKRSEEARAKAAGFASVDAYKADRREKEAKAAGFDTVEEYEASIEAMGGAIARQRSGTPEERAAAQAEGERLMREREARLKRKEAEEEAFLDPAMREKRRELERRAKIKPFYESKREEMMARELIPFERRARREAERKKQEVLGRAAGMGLTPAQMDALNQGLQRADMEFERQIKEARVQEARAAQEELDVFMQAAREQGAQALLAQQQLELQREQAEAQRSAGLFGSILSGVATLGAAALPFVFSDERMKSNVDRGKTAGAAYDFLENLDVAQYNMPGRRTPEMGVMAQSMERSDLGQQAVEEVGGVKGVNVNEAFKSLIVAQKEMHDRLKKLESE